MSRKIIILITILIIISIFVLSFVTGYNYILKKYGYTIPLNRKYDYLLISEPNPETGTQETVIEVNTREPILYIKSEYDYLVIYNMDGSVYDSTDIRISNLSFIDRISILNTKFIYSFEELYGFLESYTS